MSYGKVHDVFWDDDKIEALTDRAALLGLYLITGRHRNAIGCFKLGVGAISDNHRFQEWGIEGVSDALFELSEIGFIVRDDRSGWTFIVNALKHDPIKGAKAGIHAAKLALAIPANLNVYKQLKERLEPQLTTEMKTVETAPGWPMREPIEGVSVAYVIPKRSPEPSPFPSPEPEPAAAARALEPVAEIVSRETSLEQAEARRICEAFNAEVETIFTSQTHLPHATNYHTALAMVREDYTADLCRPVFVAVLTRMCAGGKSPPSSLSYFCKPLADAKAAANKPMPEGNADDHLVAGLPAHLDSRKRAANSFDRAVDAARGLVAGG